jgi:hypothetical protein
MAIGVLAVASIPSTSAAQLGKLTKKATNAAANAAGVPTGNSRSVKKIDLTASQLAQVNAGLASAVKTGPETIKRWEKAQEDYDKALGEYTKKKEKYDACVEAEEQKGRDKMESVNKKSEKASQDMQSAMPDSAALMAKAQAAQAAAERVKNGTATAADRQTLAEYQQMMAGVSGNVGAVQAAMQEGQAVHKAVSDSVKRKCGEEPQAPSRTASGSRAGKSGGAPPTSASEEINQTSAAAAGMSEEEYRLMKEKAMGYAASNTTVEGGTDTPPDQAKAINDALAQTRDLMAQANKANVPLM